MGLVLVRYGEIALKGRNRPMFLRRLRRNIRASLAAYGLQGEVFTRGRRAFVHTLDPIAALEPLSRVFGVVSASPVASVEPDLDAILTEALLQATKEGLGPGRTFRIVARRADKTFPILSPELERQVGAAVVARHGATVDLSRKADVTIGIEVCEDTAMVYSRTIRGPGGLPVGIEGSVVALLSGGTDSFVAAWMMIKRGCSVIPLHLAMFTDDSAAVLEQVAQLQRYSYGWELRPAIVDYHHAIEPLLQQLQGPREQRWTCLVCKHAMLSAAANIASEFDAHGIVMGDSMGQVASQTLRNLEAVSFGITMPIYRPLIGMDKNEIVALAQEIGAPSSTTEAHPPCPFVPDSPITRASLDSFAALWERLSAVEAIV
ncbi:MAG: tRNA uracil 4-sulfurtransferase ThiI [Anaerolineae bacterium]